MDQQQPQQQGGGGIPRIAIFIGLIVLLNVLSQVFGWGFIFY